MRPGMPVILGCMAPSSLANSLAAAIPPPPEGVEEAGSALMLWLILAGGLLVFLIVLVLLSVWRRTHGPAKPPRPPLGVDAWKAAAERLEAPRGPEES